jgi:TRAP-type uncharacterized transport system substrate-binding protein
MPLRLVCCVLCWALIPAASGADRIKVTVDGSERSNNAQIVRSIATLVAKPADIEFDVRYSVGPPDALVRLREGSGQQFAVLPADVAEAYLGAAARGNIEASRLLAPIRVVASIGEEEIYFVVRSDSPLNFVHEIENARINLGLPNGSTALTTAMLYRLMFNAAIPDQQVTFHSHQNALVKLTEQAVDVVALVAPNPARLLAEMKPEARRFVKLLKFDSTRPGAGRVLNVYSKKLVPAANYPNLLSEDLPALAVKIYLVSHGRNDTLQTRFANAWCQNWQLLRDQGHPALRGLELALPRLVSGWNYSRPFERELNACMEGKRVPAETCSQEDHALGLCG